MLITLGIALLITDKTQPMLFNAIGLFWLISGIIGFRRNLHRTGRRLLLVFSVVAMIAGILVLTSGLLRPLVAETILFGILSIVILLNGILHVSTRYLLGHRSLHGLRLLNTLLGILEIILGVLLLLALFSGDPLFFDSIVNVAIIWALLGGLSLLVSIIVLRRKSRKHSIPNPDTSKNRCSQGKIRD